jgi:hypothetical protein
MPRFILFLLLAGAAGWAALRHYRQQNRLHQQLAQLTAVLTAQNDRINDNAENTIKGIEAAVIKNKRQPADVLVLRRAEALHEDAKQLATTLQAASAQLRRATGNQEALPLQHPGAAIGGALDTGAPRWPALKQRLASYADTLRQLGLWQARSAPLQAPTFTNNTPVAEALADLTRLGSEILACQTHALQSLGKRVGAPRWVSHPLAVTTARSSVVAPGDTYRAELGLVGYFSAKEIKMQLACNGRPVPIAPNGTGLIRFRAPTRPGPATWTGTIRLNQNGRDTTFKVTVPYRVVRR